MLKKITTTVSLHITYTFLHQKSILSHIHLQMRPANDCLTITLTKVRLPIREHVRTQAVHVSYKTTLIG